MDAVFLPGLVIISAEPRESRALPRVLAGVAALTALCAWVFYWREGLILSHYDAKAHLVVARRVIDNITPGWEQFGAVWLPLPHLIHFIPTQIDFFYRTGAFASLVSIACFTATTWAVARFVLSATGSLTGATTAAALLCLNPSLLYLHVTPMTEPLLLATTTLAVLWLWEWHRAGGPLPLKIGVALCAAAWTRYEAWPVIAAAVAASGYGLHRRSAPVRELARHVTVLASAPVIAIALFLLNSQLTVGAWFVSSGFYVPDPTYQGRLGRTLVAIWWGVHQMSSYLVEATALATATALVARGATSRRASLTIPVALLAGAALPFAAFYQGHPFRVRYMVPLVAACALFCGFAVGFLAGRDRARTALRRVASGMLAIALVGSSMATSPPWQERGPLLEEAQWDVPHSLNRRDVTRCLTASGSRGKIVASMGSLAHYMQELSGDGYAIRDFIHEGNGAIWQLVLETGPAPHATWMLVEEQAEGGDVLAQRIRRDPAFLRDMTRVCEGGGVALYRRN